MCQLVYQAVKMRYCPQVILITEFIVIRQQVVVIFLALQIDFYLEGKMIYTYAYIIIYVVARKTNQ